MKHRQMEDKRKPILKQYSFEVSDVERITPDMWSELVSLYPSNIRVTFDDLKDFNIIRIVFGEDSACEIQSIGGTASRMMVLPIQANIGGVFKKLLSRVTVH